jgi:hypothetical protein
MSKFITEHLVGLLITIAGGIIVAWYIGEGERFHSIPLTITVTSESCAARDFYVDGEKVITSINPGTTRAFKTAKGEHVIYSCLPMTDTCGEAMPVNWGRSTSYSIAKDAQCPIQIELTNEGCTPQDYYVDGRLVAPAIAPNSTVSFEILAGSHEAYVCAAGTNTCGDTFTFSWMTSTSHKITQGTSCPITVSLTNHHCGAMDFYVDESLTAAALPANSTMDFEITPGAHETYVCLPGTNTCGPKLSVNWLVSTTHSINRGSQCPVTITLTNNHCTAQDFYVDERLTAAALSPNSTVNFEVAAGPHETYVCEQGTDTCGPKSSVNWSGSTTFSISRGAQCP